MAFALSSLFGKSKKNTVGQAVTGVGSQLRLLSTVLIIAIVAAVVSQYLDTKFTVQGQRGIEEAGSLQVLSQRLARNTRLAIQGNPSALQHITEEDALIAEVLQLLDKGDATHNPATGEPRAVLDEVIVTAQRISKEVQLLGRNRAALENLGDVTQKMERLNKELRPLVDDLVGNILSPATSQFAMFVARMEADIATVTLGDEITMDHFTSLSMNTHEATNILGKIPGSAPGLTTLKEKYKNYREAVETVLVSSRELVAVKAARATLLDNSDLLLAQAEQLTKAYASTLKNRVTFMAVITSRVMILILIIAFAIVYLTDLRRRTREAEKTNRRNQDSILKLMNEMGELADGNLTVQATVSEDITGAIADSVNYTISELRKLVTGITNVSGKVARATGAAEVVAKEQLIASQKQSDEIRNAGQSVELITKSIQEVDASAAQSLQVAKKTLAATEEGARAVQNTVAGMDEIRGQIQETSKRIKRLGESSQEIGEIVNLIADITEQTNVLALNAAIQAASAGDAGRGFSVVAAEVQRLAERSAEATKQISTLVQAIQGDTQNAIAAMETSTNGVVNGAKLASAAGQSLREIEQVSRELASLIGSISVSTQVQTDMAHEVATTMADILKITEQTSEGTKRTSASVTELAGLATGLKSSVAGFKV
ncbi:MAG: methyl-accepting chemotaxis protein [Candidatus Nitrotoga sp.]